jgi:transposase-like protein
MQDDDLIEIGPNKHLIQCPHCQKQTVHQWPGETILFSTAKCMHCGRGFVIALNQPRRDP